MAHFLQEELLIVITNCENRVKRGDKMGVDALLHLKKRYSLWGAAEKKIRK